ncbi:MAG: methyltransferase [Gammaproteobacteria bacterium]|nr:methyltransferase [Gammaproteobacteria bacterium]
MKLNNTFRSIVNLSAVLALLVMTSGLTARAQGDPCGVRDAVNAPDRSEEDRAKDPVRRPLELLCFAGVGPGMQVLDLSAGAGYTTELLARIVGSEGRVIAHNTPMIVEKILKGRFQARLEKPVMAPVEHWVAEFNNPVPPGTAGLDLVTAFFAYHDVAAMGGDRAVLSQALLDALRPGGILLVVDHAADVGVGATQGTTTHRIEAELLKQELVALGFGLVDEAEFLRQPEDPRDQPFFKLPAGSVDQFVLRFRKPVQ